MNILLSDDHPVYLAGLRSLFDSIKEIEVIGEATNGEEAIVLVEELKPDIVIMDINMPGVNGIEATRKILTLSPGTKILALSMHHDKHFVREMLDAGAAGYLLKDDAPEELVKAIEIVNKGDMFLSPRITRAALDRDKRKAETEGQLIVESLGTNNGGNQKEKMNLLTPKELQILKCISRGLRNQEIANELYNSELTVKKHISNMLQKMKVRNRLSLVSKAKEMGVL